MSRRANARDEWSEAERTQAKKDVLGVMTLSLAVAARRHNHAAAEGGNYQ
ncbi:hypothetical protein LPA44_04045 [Halobacterium sp. KA-4]|nr:hypothetical protein [Halobacterium sp. KA-4]MCD2199070.1 hypothetical protein [Halobacterium sp. KA-4]